MVKLRLLFIALFLISVAFLYGVVRELNKYSEDNVPIWLIFLGLFALTALFICMTIMMVI